MTHWDQDIHKIQEIQQLLRDRQRYFSEHLNTSFYKLNPDGSPLSFPKLPSANKSPNSNEPSLGHSVEANFGSTDTCSNDLPLGTLKENDEEDENSAHSDSSNGNQADYSQNESSVASGKTVTKKKVVRKTAKTLRKWVTKNLKLTSTPNPRRKSNASTTENANSRKSSIIRFKSVSFDEDSSEVQISQSEPKENDLLCELTSSRASKKLKSPNPMKMLKRRSWELKAEMISRLNEDARRLSFNKVMTSVSKSSISHARDKLKKAEKSLKAVAKNEHKVSVYKKQVAPAVNSVYSLQTKTSSKFKPTLNKPAAFRLAFRQQEEALRSDLNLREAFALIKIDPDPILELRTSAEKNSKSVSTDRKIALVTEKDEDTKTKFKEKSRKSFDDSRTTESLKRLAKLSIQHLQRQQSLIPSSVPQQLHSQKGREIERKARIMTGKSVNTLGDVDLTKSLQSSTIRKSSIACAASSGLWDAPSSIPRQSKNFGKKHISNLTSSGMAEIARIDQLGPTTLHGEHRHVCTLDRLSGTVV